MHEGNLRRYLKPFFGDEDVAAIGPEQVGELRRHLLTPGATERKEPLSGKSVEDVLGTLRRVLTHAEVRAASSRRTRWRRGSDERRRVGAAAPHPTGWTARTC